MKSKFTIKFIYDSIYSDDSIRIIKNKNFLLFK